MPVVIVGDSRILFDIDLDRAEQLTEVRPLQLAIAAEVDCPSSKTLPGILTPRAWPSSAWPNWRIRHPVSTVRPQKALALSQWESPSNGGYFLIQRFISPAFAMSTITINSVHWSFVSIATGGVE